MALSGGEEMTSSRSTRKDGGGWKDRGDGEERTKDGGELDYHI